MLQVDKLNFYALTRFKNARILDNGVLDPVRGGKYYDFEIRPVSARQNGQIVQFDASSLLPGLDLLTGPDCWRPMPTVHRKHRMPYGGWISYEFPPIKLIDSDSGLTLTISRHDDDQSAYVRVRVTKKTLPAQSYEEVIRLDKSRTETISGITFQPELQKIGTKIVAVLAGGLYSVKN